MGWFFPVRQRDYHLAAAPRIFATVAATVALIALLGLSCARIGTTPGELTPDAAQELAPIDLPSEVVDLGRPDVSIRDINFAPICGDGLKDATVGEVCDDGNTHAGDGCAADCKSLDPNFACDMPGKPCVYLVKCGDGVVAGTENCDPPAAGSGCSAVCRLEPGYVCEPPGATPDPGTPARCHKSVCGDGNAEGAEACDDKNDVDGDGCGAACTLEPDCTAGSCASRCGDNVKLAPEACDDGNTKAGDGCSPACETEKGFVCTDAAMTPPMQLKLLVTYRDMIALPANGAVRHPDFETFGGSAATLLLVKDTLDTDGKPALDGRCTQVGTSTQCPSGQQLTTDANFRQWYRDVDNVNIPIKDALLLPRQPDGSYLYDSGQGFYPLDNKGWAVSNPVRETSTHNYGFTTEVHYFFQYRGGESLSFSGDDDLWIFVNRRLALDLGGLHTRLQGTLNLDQSAAALGLMVGGLYEIALFQAERHSTGSNFKLTLTGFAPTSSTCASTCGDGMLASTEQCDDGNTEDSDGCSHDCSHEIVIVQ